MRPVDRVLVAIDHEEPDRVPLTDHIYMPQSLERILGESDVRIDTPAKYVKVHRLLGLDLICAFPDSGGTVNPGDQKSETIDEWGVRHRIVDTMPWYIEGPIRSLDDFESYTTPDPSLPLRVRTAREIVRLVKGDLAIAGIVDGPFTRSWLLSGLDLFVKAIYLRPGAIRRILQEVTEYAIELGKAFIEAGVDLVWIPDDLGTVDGPFLSPNVFRHFIFPYLRELVDSFKKRSVRVLLHCDGQIMPLIDDLIEIGLDGLHPIERKAGMNLAEMKATYGDKLALVGNVDATDLLPRGKEEDIERQVLECLKTAASGGGYILASDHSIHEGVPSESAKTMFRLAKKYGEYPIRID